MARTASKFDNHQTFGTFGETPEVAGLTTTERTVVASDKDTQRSGEVTVNTFEFQEGNENPLSSVLALYNGSDVELANAALRAYNDSLIARAKSHVVDSIIGPEKTLIKTVKRVLKAMGVDEAGIEKGIQKAKENPAYFNMLMELAGK